MYLDAIFAANITKKLNSKNVMTLLGRHTVVAKLLFLDSSFY